MPLGVAFRSYLTDQVEKTDVVLAIIGPNWLRLIQDKANDPKDFVRIEIEAALKQGKPVGPVLINASVPDEEDLPPSIAKRAYLNGMPVDVGADFRPGGLWTWARLIARYELLIADSRGLSGMKPLC